jgi:hypothetical protein
MADVDFNERYAPAEATRGSWAPIDESTLSEYPSGDGVGKARGRYAQLTYLVGSEPGALQLSLSGSNVILPVSSVNIDEPVRIENEPGDTIDVTLTNQITTVSIVDPVTIVQPVSVVFDTPITIAEPVTVDGSVAVTNIDQASAFITNPTLDVNVTNTEPISTFVTNVVGTVTVSSINDIGIDDSNIVNAIYTTSAVYVTNPVTAVSIVDPVTIVQPVSVVFDQPISIAEPVTVDGAVTVTNIDQASAFITNPSLDVTVLNTVSAVSIVDPVTIVQPVSVIFDRPVSIAEPVTVDGAVAVTNIDQASAFITNPNLDVTVTNIDQASAFITNPNLDVTVTNDITIVDPVSVIFNDDIVNALSDVETAVYTTSAVFVTNTVTAQTSAIDRNDTTYNLTSTLNTGILYTFNFPSTINEIEIFNGTNNTFGYFLLSSGAGLGDPTAFGVPIRGSNQSPGFYSINREIDTFYVEVDSNSTTLRIMGHYRS